MSARSLLRRRPAPKRRLLTRRRIITTRVLIAASVGGALTMVAVLSYGIYINSAFSNFGRVDTSLLANRPEDDKALNILLLGADKAEDVTGAVSLQESVEAKKWPTGRYRSDTIMIVHIPKDRKAIQLVSIPRDTYTMIYDPQGKPQGRNKINSAFALYGPSGTIATIEAMTGLRLDHLAILDWDGFRAITKAVGGVEVTVAETFYDPKNNIRWTKGKHVLEGEEALQYVRTRYGLLRGDFDRIARQQNFLRALMKKMLSDGVTKDPVRLAKTVEALSKNMAIDADWSNGSVRSLALSLRSMKADDVTFLTAPVAGTEELEGVGSIVRLNDTISAELWTALRENTMPTYVAARPQDVLAGEKDVR